MHCCVELVSPYMCISYRLLVVLVSLSADVPVSVIASFKKMKALTEDKELILRAIKNSPMLEVCG